MVRALMPHSPAVYLATVDDFTDIDSRADTPLEVELPVEDYRHLADQYGDRWQATFLARTDAPDSLTYDAGLPVTLVPREEISAVNIPPYEELVDEEPSVHGPRITPPDRVFVKINDGRGRVSEAKQYDWDPFKTLADNLDSFLPDQYR